MDLFEFTRLFGAKAEQFADSGLNESERFAFLIREQNAMFELPMNLEPTVSEEDLNEPASKRITGFLKTMQKEIDEGQLIHDQLVYLESLDPTLPIDDTEAVQVKLGLRRAEEVWLNYDEIREKVIVNIADWFADISVYNRSEAMKFGIPLEAVQQIVMGSNFTKLGEDGKPIKDENGKFLKGPNFIPPEAGIHALLFKKEELLEEAFALTNLASLANSTLIPALTQEGIPEGDAEDEYDDEDDEDEYEDEEGTAGPIAGSKKFEM